MPFVAWAAFLASLDDLADRRDGQRVLELAVVDGRGRAAKPAWLLQGLCVACPGACSILRLQRVKEQRPSSRHVRSPSVKASLALASPHDNPGGGRLSTGYCSYPHLEDQNQRRDAHP